MLGDAVNQAENLARTQLPGELGNAYSAIRAHAPNGGADVLDSVIQQAAVQHGFAFVSALPYFSGHLICDSSPWLHSTDWFFLTDSYHPNASGQAGAYLPAFSSAA